MSLPRRLTEPVRAPIRRAVDHHVTFFEDLIHAVKSELVGQIEVVGSRVNELERSVSTSHDTITDQISLQAAALRSLGTEVERLRRLAEELEAEAQPAVDGDRPTATNGQLARPSR